MKKVQNELVVDSADLCMVPCSMYSCRALEEGED